jgi:drug/metabolite transporter (DMT)-like permease
MERVMNKSSTGWINGFVGMLIFSGSLPATRIAETAFDPVFLTVTRAFIAASLAVVLLIAFRQTRPARGDLVSLAIVSAGVVVGFPLLTAFALRQITSANSMIFIGLLPLATAACAVWRGGERPHLAFWLFAGSGSLIIMGFACLGGATIPPAAGFLMTAAILVCGLGYAEGAKLSCRLGGWQVICWALILALPITAPLMFITWPAHLSGIGHAAWGGLFYVSLFSMMIRLCLLVSRSGPGRHGQNRSIAIASAVLWIDHCRRLAARIDWLANTGSHVGRHVLRTRCQKVRMTSPLYIRKTNGTQRSQPAKQTCQPP